MDCSWEKWSSKCLAFDGDDGFDGFDGCDGSDGFDGFDDFVGLVASSGVDCSERIWVLRAWLTLMEAQMNTKKIG